MDIKIGIRDRRQSGWYRVDNEVYDIPMSCEALAVYNAVARFANNQTEKAYFSGKKWKKHHKVGNGKLSKGIRELIGHNLIRPTGETTDVGAPYYELCNIDHLKTLSQGGTGGCSEAEQGGVLRRNTNKTKTNNKDKESHADAWTPPFLKDTKTSKKKTKSVVNHYPEIQSLLNILSESGEKLSTISQNMRRLMYNAVELHGLEFCERALRGRVIQASRKGTGLSLSAFFDPEAGQWLSDCAKLVSGQTVQSERVLTDDEKSLYEEMQQRLVG